jgi:hypothetical protein
MSTDPVVHSVRFGPLHPAKVDPELGVAETVELV